MQHIFEKAAGDYTLVLLHGTGGNEHNLIPLAKQLAPDKHRLAIRGNVNENGSLRFFKRKAEGVYDLKDLEERSVELGRFILEAAKIYNFDPQKTILLGFSNGANIATHLLLHQNFTFRYGALLSPLYPQEIDLERDLSSHQYFISMGKNDPLCSMEENEILLRKFNKLEIKTSIVWGDGHNINQEISTSLAKWLKKF